MMCFVFFLMTLDDSSEFRGHMRTHRMIRARKKRKKVALLFHIQSTFALFWFLSALRLWAVYDDHSTDPEMNHQAIGFLCASFFLCCSICEFHVTLTNWIFPLI